MRFPGTAGAVVRPVFRPEPIIRKSNRATASQPKVVELGGEHRSGKLASEKDQTPGDGAC